MITEPPSLSRRRARRILAALALGTAAALAAAFLADRPERRLHTHATAMRTQSSSAGLQRCQTLGDSALGDAGCRAVWSEHRRRFMGRESRP